MDLFAELKNMAVNAADNCDEEFEPAKEDIKIWQTLFVYSYSKAVE